MWFLSVLYKKNCLQLEDAVYDTMSKIDFNEATTDNVLLSVERNVSYVRVNNEENLILSSTTKNLL